MTGIHWRAVLAPLGQPTVPAQDRRTLLPRFALSFIPPVPLTYGGPATGPIILGAVTMAAIDAGDAGSLVAAGTLDPDTPAEIVDAMRDGHLVPGFDLIEMSVMVDDDGSVDIYAGRLSKVVARPVDVALWPGVVRFEISRRHPA